MGRCTVIYYAINPLTKKKTIIVKSIDELPQDSKHTVTNMIYYYINNAMFADIITLPSTSTNTELDIQHILQYNFQNNDVKTFDDKDKLLAYLTYIGN